MQARPLYLPVSVDNHDTKQGQKQPPPRKRGGLDAKASLNAALGLSCFGTGELPAYKSWIATDLRRIIFPFFMFQETSFHFFFFFLSLISQNMEG